MNGCIEHSRGEQIELANTALSEAEKQFGKDSAEIRPALENLGELLHADGLYAKAELLYHRLAELGAKGGNTADRVDALARLGMLYRQQGKLDDAETVYLRAVAALDEMAENSRCRAERLCCLSGLYVDKKEYAQAEEILQRARESWQQIFGDRSLYGGFCELALACLCQKQGKPAKAEEHFLRSQQIDADDPQDTGYERVLLELAQSYFQQGRYNETEKLLDQVVFSDLEKLWPNHPAVGLALHERGELFQAQGQYRQSEVAFQRALEIRRRTLGKAHAEVANTAFCLAILYLAENQLVEAEPVLKLAMRTRVLAFGVDHPGVAACLETYVALLKRTKRGAIAVKLEARARDIRSQLVLQSDRIAAAGR